MRRELATFVLVVAVGHPQDDPRKEPDIPAKPVRNCVDVLAVVRTYAPHYDTQRETMPGDDFGFLCDITYTESPELDDFGNYLELGVLDDILVSVATGDDERPEECPPEGYCVEAETEQVAEQPGMPAVDLVLTTVTTAHVLLSMSEETHGPQTPTDEIVQIALDIEAGRPG